MGTTLENKIMFKRKKKTVFLSFNPWRFILTLQVCAVVSWDSSIHDSVHLNRLTPNTERVYLILKVVVRLSHPAAMELVLRKRLAINVYKRQSITDKLKKRISKSVSSLHTSDQQQHINGLVKDCGISIANALEIPQPFTKPSTLLKLTYLKFTLYILNWKLFSHV